MPPKTVVLCTDVFDEFMETHNVSNSSVWYGWRHTILRYFLKAKLDRLVEDFFTFFDVVKSPIAVRSTAKMLITNHSPAYTTPTASPLSPDDKYEMLRIFGWCHKGRLCFRLLQWPPKPICRPRAMWLIRKRWQLFLREVVGTAYNDHYYPSMSRA